MNYPRSTRSRPKYRGNGRGMSNRGWRPDQQHHSRNNNWQQRQPLQPLWQHRQKRRHLGDLSPPRMNDSPPRKKIKVCDKSTEQPPNLSNQANRGNFSGQAIRRLDNNFYKAPLWSGNNSSKDTKRIMGFKRLEEIALSDSKDIVLKINNDKNQFFNLIQSPIDKPDIFVLIMELMSKVSQSSFTETKSNILLKICDSKYIENLQNYLMKLPYVQHQDKTLNDIFWSKPQEFWTNFVTFCECIINLSPTTALQKCSALIQDCSKCCLDNLGKRHGFALSDEFNAKMNELRDRLVLSEREKMQQPQDSDRDGAGREPPENFRNLSVVPNSDELLERRPFVRPNIVSGGYRNVEHYLDVQFRLLREDCFGPVREGIIQYMKQPNKKKIDHIRVHRNVRFVGPYSSKFQSKVGLMVQIDLTTSRLRRVNWAHSKRFLYGSLLLFTKDDCNSFIVATILDRSVKLLLEGKIPVTIVTMGDEDIYNDDSYVMIESEVYLEPYFHVLEALQDPDFPGNMPMAQYIVNVNPEAKPPVYLNPDTTFSLVTDTMQPLNFKVLDEEEWPTKEDLGLNESQYEAYKLALTHEFAVIQGPPGTGKSYLGVKVAQTLLDNMTAKIGCLMIVICYTNHALDQFLEDILPFTKSVARIGGRSRNETLNQFNLNNLRHGSSLTAANNLYRANKWELKRALCNLQKQQKTIDCMINGIVSYNIIKSIPESNVLSQYYGSHRSLGDPLKFWLFENCMDEVDTEPIFTENPYENTVNVPEYFYEEIRNENEPLFDDFEGEDNFDVNSNPGVKTCFSMNASETEMRRLITEYKKCRIIKEKCSLEQRIRILHCEMALFRKMSTNRKLEIPLHLNEASNLSIISTEDRWTLYFRWASVIMNELKAKIPELQEQLNSSNRAYEEARMMVDMELLRNKRVVGITTSGAARLRKLLRSLAPRIVIVEEAAEVLEQHIVTSLTKGCQHLILIGDHQQLRPSIAHVKLARQRKCYTDVSLFERMITNGMHSRRLGVQHRMRPEIAALISPHIYADLANHPTVQTFPEVRGMTKNLFFLTHCFREEEVDDSSSRSNHAEADLVLQLGNYLMQQGYDAADVTILTIYSAQMFYMKRASNTYPHLIGVKITVVDNYQGEESKIILLSLVRNNEQNEVGFLNNKNRICVALSRAKEGLYIFGNIDALRSNSDLWNNIATTLGDSLSLGTSLQLKCENHPQHITNVSSPANFKKVREGGCELVCNYERKCGHKCPMLCHGYDREHEKIKCHDKCERELCDLKHICPLKCAEACEPCLQLVQKDLPCTHSMQVPCHKIPGDPSIKCSNTVTVKLPNCGHEVKKICYVAIEIVKCPEPCNKKVDCGHKCGLKCHANCDPDHEKYMCHKPCAKIKTRCTAYLDGDFGDHRCKKQCFETCDDCNVQMLKSHSTCKHKQRVACSVNIDEIPCNDICGKDLPCKHKCRQKCFELCKCTKKVKKIIPECKHEIQTECSTPATRELCTGKCRRKLSCTHPCPELCRVPCDPTKCNILVPNDLKLPCGHQVELPCNIYTSIKDGVVDDKTQLELLLRHCTEPCTVELACGHVCGGSCSRCHQSRLHVACAQPCQQTNICGHRCQEPCNQICPPCKMPCEVRCPCQDNHCPKLCGAPCVPCAEPCKRACVHGACGRRCGEPCGRPPCDAPCPKRLVCGHRCRGLCGEPCPAVCRDCRPDEFPKDFLGYDFEEDDKFVQLKDCTHVMELKNLDSMMKRSGTQEQDGQLVKIPTCPWCRTPIVNTYRYKDIINRMFKEEINPIKVRVYGTKTQIEDEKHTLSIKVARLRGKCGQFIKENPHWKSAFDQINTIITEQRNVSRLQLEMRTQYLNILTMIGDCYQEFKNNTSNHLRDEIYELIKLICCTLVDNAQKISQQQQKDIGNEMKRMNSILQLSKILSHPYYSSSTEVVEATDNAKTAILTWRIYKESESLEPLKALQELVKADIAVKKERALVVKAIGLKAGHWYKCPNGHFYCIGECGGAMQSSRCIECRADIGGRSHGLLPGNSHAHEMDGSRYAAWSEENNMANYNLNDIF